MTRRWMYRSRSPARPSRCCGAACRRWRRAGRRHRPLDLGAGSYFGRRRTEDGRIDWRCAARTVHDLVRAVAPPFPGAFTEVNGCRLAVIETRVDAQPVKFASQAPCLYADSGEWFADCVDGRRLRILRLALDGKPVSPDGAPPALAQQPLNLSCASRNC